MGANNLIVVIHVVGYQQAKRNAEIALGNGADGIFLINHDVADEVLGDIYGRLRAALGHTQFIGLNFLKSGPVTALKVIDKHAWGDVSALWMDDTGYVEGEDGGVGNLDSLTRLKDELADSSFRGLVFGGVDFKYQTPARDLALVTRIMSEFVDVVTTSGPVTGSPPELNKIKLMRQAVPFGKKLAIASGMTPENVEPFLEYADYFLVATGVSRSHTELDETRVQLMAKKFGNL